MPLCDESNVAPAVEAPLNSAPLSRAFSKLASSARALTKLAPWSLACLKSACCSCDRLKSHLSHADPARFAFCIFAPLKDDKYIWALARSVLSMMAPSKTDALILALSKEAKLRSAPRKETPEPTAIVSDAPRGAQIVRGAVSDQEPGEASDGRGRRAGASLTPSFHPRVTPPPKFSPQVFTPSHTASLTASLTPSLTPHFPHMSHVPVSPHPVYPGESLSPPFRSKSGGVSTF